MKLQQLILTGVLSISLVGGLSTVNTFADSKVSSKIVKEVKADAKVLTKNYMTAKKYTKQIEKTDIIDDVISTKNAKVRNAYETAYEYALLREATQKGTKFTDGEYTKATSYLDKQVDNDILRMEGKKVKANKLPKKLATKLTNELDRLKAINLSKHALEITDDKDAKQLADYADKVRKDRLDKNKMDSVTGAYLSINQMLTEPLKGNSSKKSVAKYTKFTNDVKKSIELLSK